MSAVLTGNTFAYLKPLPNMLHVLQAKFIDLQRHTLAIHLYQDLPRSHIACWVLSGKLDGFLSILQRRLEILESLMTCCAIVVKLHRWRTADGTIEQL
jgi:hypothetical protein